MAKPPLWKRLLFKKTYGVSWEKARKMSVNDFSKGPMLNKMTRDGVKAARKRKWRI
jgi:hypothetical protein